MDEDEVIKEFNVYLNPRIGDGNTELYLLQSPSLMPNWRLQKLEEICSQIRVDPQNEQMEIDLSTDAENGKETLLYPWRQPALDTAYAVGVQENDNFYINPIHRVGQLQSSMQHLNSGASASEADRQTNIALEYYGSITDCSDGYVKKMLKRETSPTEVTMQMSSLEERIKKVLSKDSSIHKYTDLMEILNSDESSEELLEVLQNHGRLVQGLWVPKSELLFLERGKHRAAVRDHVLFLFSKKVLITSRELNKIPSPLRFLEKSFLQQFAEPIRGSCWLFKKGSDKSFLNEHPYIFNNQGEEWERRAKNVANYFRQVENGIPKNPYVEAMETMSDEVQESHYQLRNVVLDLLQQKQADETITRVEVQQVASFKLDRQIGWTECNEVMNDLCRPKGPSIWGKK